MSAKQITKPQVFVEEKVLKKLAKKGVPEAYLEEMRNGVRNRIQELEQQVCPECGGSVKLKQYPDFKCKKKHVTNANFLKVKEEEPDPDREELQEHGVSCFFCGEAILTEEASGGFVMPDGETETAYCQSEECQAKAEEFMPDSTPTPQEPKEKSRLKVRFNSKSWKAILDNLSQIIDEAYFTADSKGLFLKCMDASHVAMVDLSIGKAFFEVYDIEGKPDLAFEIAQMLVFFKKSKTDEITELSYDSETEKIHLSTTNKKWARNYKLKSLVAFPEEEIPTPKISFSTTIKLVSTTLRDTIDDLSAISDHVVITATATDKLTLQADGEWGDMWYDLEKTSEEILSFESKEKEVKAMYSFSYLSEMVKQGTKVSDIVLVEFSTDMPIRLTFNLNNGKLIYYLAPRIESSE